jgi:aryl-alcohol dehydrogenase-like predicted oxidoreductase
MKETMEALHHLVKSGKAFYIAYHQCMHANWVWIKEFGVIS